MLTMIAFVVLLFLVALRCAWDFLTWIEKINAWFNSSPDNRKAIIETARAIK